MTREIVLEALPLLPKFFTEQELLDAVQKARKTKERSAFAYPEGLRIRDSVYKALSEALPSLQSDYFVAKIGVFGSVAAGTAIPESDVDIFVVLEKSSRYFELAHKLECLLDREVDLLTPGIRNKELLKSIEETVEFIR